MTRLPGRLGDAGEVQVLGQRLKVLNPNGGRSGTAVQALLLPGGDRGVGDRTDLRILVDAVVVEEPEPSPAS